MSPWFPVGFLWLPCGFPSVPWRLRSDSRWFPLAPRWFLFGFALVPYGLPLVPVASFRFRFVSLWFRFGVRFAPPLVSLGPLSVNWVSLWCPLAAVWLRVRFRWLPFGFVSVPVGSLRLLRVGSLWFPVGLLGFALASL